ncbi:MAG: single-stranded DNA-binding protein [Candidatus Heimdallarchaeota archaeon]|nr:single-stranded DNA-binding protein [Candidatus Heimdallarchaeota archaeon]
MKIIDLKADMRNVDIRFRVIDKGEIKEITTRDGKKLKLSEVEVGDDTGRIYLTLWESTIEEVDNGDVAEVINGYIKVIRNELRLNVGKYGKLVKIDEEKDFAPIEKIPEEFPQPKDDYRKKRY